MQQITPELIDEVFRSNDIELQDLLFNALTHPYYTFQPRVNSPNEFDEQTAFVERNYRLVRDPRNPALAHYEYAPAESGEFPETFKICLGGTGSGKTQAAAYKTAAHVLETEPPRPRTPFWVIGETYPQICQGAWAEKLSHLIPENMIADIRWYDTRRKWPHAVLLKHPNNPRDVGWILEFKSYEQGLGGMKAVSIGGYWLNEECPYHLVTEVQGRCRDYDSPGWADFTPVECRDPEWPEAYDNPPPGWRFYHLNSLKNSALAPGFMERYLAGVPEDMREMRTVGKFTSLRGQVYKEFRKSLHVCDPFRIPRDWHRVRCMDFGFNNPFCCLWAARDHDNRWYIYDEHYESQRLVRYHVEKINQRTWEVNNPYCGRTYTDHDAQVRAELAKEGIQCTLGNKSINQGIEFIRSLMIVQEDGRPRLQIFPGCVNLLREIVAYRWPDASLHRNPNDVPEDKDNHCLVAGTLVKTLRGQVPIEEVTTDDHVLTFHGGCPKVLFAGPTRVAQTVVLKVKDGRTIEGTPDHLIFSVEHGHWGVGKWVQIGSLKPGDELSSLKEGRGKDIGCIPCIVESVSELSSELKQTYDLTVADCPEFFANGILVHNSLDAMRYGLFTDTMARNATKPDYHKFTMESGRHGVNLRRTGGRG